MGFLAPVTATGLGRWGSLMGSEWWALRCQQAEEPPALRARPQRLMSVPFPVLSPLGCPQHHCGFSLRLDFFLTFLLWGKAEEEDKRYLTPSGALTKRKLLFGGFCQDTSQYERRLLAPRATPEGLKGSGLNQG